MNASAPADDPVAAADLPRPKPAPLDDATMREWPLPLHRSGDKHARGTVLVIGGSPGTVGAVVLAGIAALRVGAGRLQLAVAEPGVLAATTAVPEALVATLPVHDDGRLRPARAAAAVERFAQTADAILIGPGLIADAATERFVHQVVGCIGEHAVVVLDAAAVGAMDDLATAIEPVRSRTVLVANRQELHRLASHAGMCEATPQDVGIALGAVVTSFGTVAATDGRSWCSRDGTAGLGTSGSGDVLAGLVAGAAARCGDAVQAACWATYVHAAVGARLSRGIARVGYLAREIADAVPGVVRDVERPHWTSSPS